MARERPLELWGGIECTVARLGDEFRDQSRETGHHDRPDDLDRIADLGIRTVRYPVLWEAISPDSPDAAEWTWHDARLQHIRELGLRPIAGLVHHGSGPRYTNLTDPRFPELLAGHAARVAERYPWIEYYTPVNEPLTTARFSALYGHWYPHARSYGTFLRALLNQCRATVLAMRAIRQVRPDAKLVQTEDLGKTFSTPAMAYQAEHDNERRWVTFDLLCGRIGPSHPLWGFFVHWAGVDERELAFFEDADASPDIIGVNHYLTSDRFLDERVDLYPKQLHGDNGRHRYADAEAVRLKLPGGQLGPAARLRETWQRYGRPLAITEVHHGCTRDEQLRWLAEVWNAAAKVREEGADVRAVTLWSMFGTVDWNTLLTEHNGVYEPGAFDVRGPTPRPTALARAAASLARDGACDHPVLDLPGWWRCESRFYRGVRQACRAPLRQEPRRLLIAGTGGVLDGALSRACGVRGIETASLRRRDMGGADPERLAAALDEQRAWAVISLADDASAAPADAGPSREPSQAGCSEVLARACRRNDIPLVSLSSDLVFDGRLGRGYRESDPVSPASAAGARQAESEKRVREACPDALIVRAGRLFAPSHRHGFVGAVLQSLSRGRVFRASLDVVSTTYAPDFAHVVLDLLVDGETGIWHLPTPGEISWHDLAREVARRAGLDATLIAPADPGGAAPLNSALTSDRGLLLPPLASALDRCLAACEPDWRPAADVPSVAAE